MSIFEELTKRVKDCFLHTFLPSNEVFLDLVRKYLSCDGEVISRTDESATIKLKYDNDEVLYKFTFVNGSIGATKNRLCVSKIEKIQ